MFIGRSRGRRRSAFALHAAGLLEDAGFEVIEAKNATDALWAMQARSDVRVLFTDVQMPGPLDGIDLARKVHEQWPRVLLLITSGNMKPAKADIPDHGHFLAKPYRAKDVLREIDLLAREAAARP
jgi:CheY-like chemotaxis protein